MFALFRVNVHQINSVKKAALSEELLKTLTWTASGEKLDDKLAGLMINDGCKLSHLLPMCQSVFTLARCLVPLPSNDAKAWWESEGDLLETFSVICYLTLGF